MKVANAAILSQSSITVESLKIVLGVLILFAMSQIAIPMQPVPITMQTVGVMLLGLLYSRRAALISVIAYLSLGAIGAPVFQGFASGMSYLHGTTAGYLFGFIAAVFAMTTLREKFGLTNFWGMLTNCVVGTLIIFVCGVSWLASIVGINNALTFGILPFILPGALKAIVLSGGLRFVRGR